MNNLSIVIVNWNVREALHACLRSILEQETKFGLQVLVVDNASSDGSLDMVARDFPEVEVIHNSTNVGFAEANNQGIRQARGRYILVLNPDTVVRRGTLEALVDYADAHPDIGALGPMLVSENGAVDYRGGRRFPTLWSELLKRLRLVHPVYGDNAMMDWDHRTSRDVELVCGACMLLRREVIEAVGMFDEGFFLFGEDVDWCFRIRRAGWRVYYLAEAVVVHLGGKSSESARDKLGFEIARSRHRFLRKAYGSRVGLLHRLVIVATELPKTALLGLWTAFTLDAEERTGMRRRLEGHVRILCWALSNT